MESTQGWDKNKTEYSVLNTSAQKQKAIVKEVEKTVENAEGLTDKQRLFFVAIISGVLMQRRHIKKHMEYRMM